MDVGRDAVLDGVDRRGEGGDVRFDGGVGEDMVDVVSSKGLEKWNQRGRPFSGLAYSSAASSTVTGRPLQMTSSGSTGGM